IAIVQCGELQIYTAADTNNTIMSTHDVQEEDSTANAAAIFSKEDLVLLGEGSLEVISAHGNGIVSKDHLKIASGTYTVTADGHGICGKDSVCIKDGTFTITSGKDGIHAENNDIAASGSVYLFGGVYTINASGDGISASHTLQIDNGLYHITSGGGMENGAAHIETDKLFDRGDFGNRMKGNPVESPIENPKTDSDAANTELTDSDSVSCKGIKAELALEISGGSFDLNTADDALHVNGNMSILGGVFHIRTGDDGIHADDKIIITDGEINIMESYEGIEAYEIIISGGTITVTSDDDGLNASGGSAEPYENRDMQTVSRENACIQISGGDIYVDAGGDGFDSNGDIQISGGVSIIEADADSANGALDYDGEGSITGGTVLALGGSSMAMNFDNHSTQCCALINLEQQINPSSVTLYDADGAVLFTYDAKKTYNSIVISIPDMQVSMTYTLETGDIATEICMSELVYGNGFRMGMNGGASHSGRQFDFPPSGDVPKDLPGWEEEGHTPFNRSDEDVPLDRVPEGAWHNKQIPAAIFP
ncbi:MAG: carbohydrate-binding domain-containing protein, partial [Clostridia bacterium]|nr:carbohydrate-binding domain-containing protein [Clostridia bacterium]